MSRHVKKNMTYSSRPTHAARVAHAKGDKQFRTYDTSYIRPKRSKAPFFVCLFLVIAVLGAAGAAVWHFIIDNDQPTVSGEVVGSLPAGQTAVVTIPEGADGMSIGVLLAEAGLVPSSQDFYLRVIELEADVALIPGTYSFTGGMTLDEIIAVIGEGPAATGVTFTVPEGRTREATAALVEQATEGDVTAQQFLDASADASAWVGEFPWLESAGTNSLEGFLFPKTYLVTAADDANSIVRMMLNQFAAEIATLSFAYPEDAGLSLYDAVNLASIVERETVTERPTVAAIFYNRLASSRPYLESDATSAYEYGGEPTAEQVHSDTPYSTYSNPGLPPTPICSPGIVSLRAVCEPAETEYMFFLTDTDADGTMNIYFSKTYDEHLAVINSLY